MNNATITGNSIVASLPVFGVHGVTRAVNPASAKEMGPDFGLVSVDQVRDATRAAAEAFDSYRATTPEERAAFLERIADNIQAIGAELTERGVLETGLPVARLEGERGRMIGQLRLFAGVLRQGDHLQARIDHALPERQPAPRPDIRQRHIPLGPVAVFGASNFPLAFSTAGGDTASALAAGCPVVVKAHNAHPGTGELVGQAVVKAVRDSGFHPGVFSLLYGAGTIVGQALVGDPEIKAVGFTGSRGGGVALMTTAAARPEPIPVYAEMSSINPVFVLPGAIADNPKRLAADFLASLTTGAGQFCTNPGLLFVPVGVPGDAFIQECAAGVAQLTGQTMLTSAIADAYEAGGRRLASTPGVELVAQGGGGVTDNAPAPELYETSTSTFSQSPDLQDEVFGAVGLFVRFVDAADLLAATQGLQGQLTATIHATPDDHALAALLLPVLERKVGRILFNGWPTGVEVNDTMVHGGPFPATSDSRTTSVGTLAIHRFQRPVSYQNIPDELLPAPLKEANPWKLNRRIDGVVQGSSD